MLKTKVHRVLRSCLPFILLPMNNAKIMNGSKMIAPNSRLHYNSSLSLGNTHEKFITIKFVMFKPSPPKGKSTSCANSRTLVR